MPKAAQSVQLTAKQDRAGRQTIRYHHSLRLLSLSLSLSISLSNCFTLFLSAFLFSCWGSQSFSPCLRPMKAADYKAAGLTLVLRGRGA